MAIDPGSKRVGLALSDPTRTVATPFRTLPAEPASTLVARLLEVAREAGAGRLLVGLPRNLDGTSGPAARGARELAAGLREAGDLGVEMIDERLSSVAAERHLVAGGMRRERRREFVDQVAATLLLQGWLDSRHAR